MNVVYLFYIMVFPIFYTKFASLLPVLYRPFYIDKYGTVNSFVSAANQDIIIKYSSISLFIARVE